MSCKIYNFEFLTFQCFDSARALMDRKLSLFVTLAIYSYNFVKTSKLKHQTIKRSLNSMLYDTFVTILHFGQYKPNEYKLQ